jgi:hypothetical protein
MGLSGSAKFNINRFCPGCQEDLAQVADKDKYRHTYCNRACYEAHFRKIQKPVTAYDRVRARRERKQKASEG